MTVLVCLYRQEIEPSFIVYRLSFIVYRFIDIPSYFTDITP